MKVTVQGTGAVSEVASHQINEQIPSSPSSSLSPSPTASIQKRILFNKKKFLSQHKFLTIKTNQAQNNHPQPQQQQQQSEQFHNIIKRSTSFSLTSTVPIKIQLNNNLTDNNIIINNHNKRINFNQFKLRHSISLTNCFLITKINHNNNNKQQQQHNHIITNNPQLTTITTKFNNNNKTNDTSKCIDYYV